jgi:hypothetical protein
MFDLFQVMHVLGFDPHAFAHFRDERKRRRDQVYAVRYILIYFSYKFLNGIFLLIFLL